MAMQSVGPGAVEASMSQYVPPMFRQTVNITQPNNTSALAQQQKTLNQQNALIANIKKQRADIKKRYEASKNDKWRAELKKKYDALYKDLGKAQTTAAAAQNKVWELSGRYDKLLSGANRDAYAALNSLFSSFGLGSLSGKIYNYVKNGYSADTITILLQDTPEYKERFKGNEIRAKAGLPVLSPAEYLSVESSYRQIMQEAGLPAGFYDNPADFREWIGRNISPTDIQSRVDLASQAVNLAPAEFRQALNQMGIANSQLTAYFLDPDRALPDLQRSAATAAVGAEALQRGLNFDIAYSERLAREGISAEEASQGYSRIASELGTLRSLGRIYGTQWSQRESEEQVFEGQAEATRTRSRLLGQEAGMFGGATGASRGGLAQKGGAR